MRTTLRALRRYLLLSTLAGCIHTAPQQSASGAAPLTVDPFASLEGTAWKPANELRSASGAPGPAYWQQRADYRISATLDTATKRISGSVEIRYTNQSPDTLRELWLELDQNLYREGSAGARRFGRGSRWGSASGGAFVGGFRLSPLTVDGDPESTFVDDTRLRVDLSRPLAPRIGVATLRVEFAFDVPERGSDRLARDGSLFEIAQWFPRMAVYDDLAGWNTEPYLGQGEFYLEYGDVEYDITLPAGYLMTGTGTLTNAHEVLSAAVLSRLEQAAHSDVVVRVVMPDEAVASARRHATGARTWRFRAERVRDVAWVAAPDLRWDAVNANGVLAQALYRPRSSRAWEHAADQVRRSLLLYSRLWSPYPYPQATAVAGVVWGMEYPMLAMAHEDQDLESPLVAVDHEIAHQWFPMIVGSNERRFAWMDEGLATFGNAFAVERQDSTSDPLARYLESWRELMGRRRQPALMTAADDVRPDDYPAVAYNKPAAVLLALRDDVVGPDTLDRAIREFVARWSFRHPSPVDFFRSVQSVAGQDLSWFWRAFFYGTDVLDIGVDEVVTRMRDGARVAEITLTRHSSVPFPVRIRLALDGGATRDVRLPVTIWSPCAGSAKCTRTAEVAVDRDVVGARLWPTGGAMDWDDSNDRWGRAPAKSQRGPVTSGGLVPISEAKP